MTAGSLREALALIPTLNQKDIDVAIVDGNLTFGETAGNDGELVARTIKATHPRIVVIGNAAERSIVAADINCPKSLGGARLAQVVTEA